MASDSFALPTDSSAMDHSHTDHQPQPPSPSKYKLTAEEARVFRECGRESFYYRSLPLSVAAMIAVQYAVKAGRLKSHPRWGSALKVITAGAAGYVIGKISYQRQCVQKLLQLPNSPLADALRKQRQQMRPVTDKLGFDPIFGGHASESSADTENSGSWDIDTEKNVEFQGLDDSKRPTIDNPINVTEDDKPRVFETYDELRQKNRNEYQNKRHEFQQRQSEFSARSSPQNKTPSQKDPSAENVKKNPYGDVME